MGLPAAAAATSSLARRPASTLPHAGVQRGAGRAGTRPGACRAMHLPGTSPAPDPQAPRPTVQAGCPSWAQWAHASSASAMRVREPPRELSSRQHSPGFSCCSRNATTVSMFGGLGNGAGAGKGDLSIDDGARPAHSKSCRRPARKVSVFQCPCGTLAISGVPRGLQPRVRVMLVLAQVSSTKTKRAGSNRC